MPDPFFELAATTEAALAAGGKAPPDAGATLLWAAFNLRSARVGRRIVDELATGSPGYDRIYATFPEEWDVLEIAAMSLGFEDSATAIDLCANVVYLAAGGSPSPTGRFKDIGHWTIAKAAALPPATGGWVTGLLSDPDTALLKMARDALTHRTVSRHIALGGTADRSLTEITAPDGTSHGGIGVLIPKLVDYSEKQYRLCCEALQADFGT